MELEIESNKSIEFLRQSNAKLKCLIDTLYWFVREKNKNHPPFGRQFIFTSSPVEDEETAKKKKEEEVKENYLI